MSAAEKIHLEGKDWFTEAEAAAYCGVALATFRAGYRALGITPKRAFGRKLYSRSDLYRAIDGSPEWQRSTPVGKPGISVGPRAVSTSADPSERLRAQRLREYAPRKQRS